MAVNPIFHACTHHIELDYHCICERVALGSHMVQLVPSQDQIVDLLTKGLLKSRRLLLSSKLVCPGMSILQGDVRI